MVTCSRELSEEWLNINYPPLKKGYIAVSKSEPVVKSVNERLSDERLREMRYLFAVNSHQIQQHVFVQEMDIRPYFRYRHCFHDLAGHSVWMDPEIRGSVPPAFCRPDDHCVQYHPAGIFEG